MSENINLSEEKEKITKFGGHNYKADYAWTVAFGEKANGETQVKEFKYRTDTTDGMVESAIDKYLELIHYGSAKGLKMVNPYKDPNKLK